jgi:predicted rRNA methylase
MPGIEIFANLRSSTQDNYFIAESEKVVVRLLESDLEIISLYLTEEQFIANKNSIEKHRQSKDFEIILASKNEMETIVGHSLHQGILAAAKIPKERTIDQLMATADKPLLFVVLDQVADSENIGSIIRTSYGMNVTAVIIDKNSTSPWMRRAVRVSMGAVFKLPIVTVDFIPGCIEKLKTSGVRTFATTLGESALPIWDCDFTKDSAIIFGSEAHGIKQEIIKACDGEVSIPMSESSLNVGIAQGMFLYEVIRQRNMMNNGTFRR